MIKPVVLPFRCCVPVLALLLSSVSSAQSIVHSINFGPEDLSFGPNPSSSTFDHVFSFTFDRFNPALGTLNSVSVAYHFNFSGSTTNGPSGGGGSASAAGPFHLDSVEVFSAGNGGGGGGGPFATINYGFSVAGNLGAPGVGVIGPEGVTGVGATALDWSVEGSFSGNTFQLDEGGFTVTYAYTSAVPEPSTAVALAGIGILTGTVCRRRRRNL